MFSITDVTNLVKQGLTGYTVFPLEFPTNSPITSAYISLFSSSRSEAGVSPITVQIVIRDTHPAKAEAASFKLRDYLQNKTNFNLGQVQVIQAEAQSFPLYLGKDASSNYLYSNNYRFLLNEGG
ncbi:phage tail terminator protein [Bacillus cereus group sp. MYBK215-1]|uniref:phage tail terminator protein n=1 Tax=unclassified Bacillus cereus group TaxID=2750818 RepID=UPI003F78BB9B